MKVGIIGAGKVGVSIAKYFFTSSKNFKLSGFFSKSDSSSVYASNITKTKTYEKIEDIVSENDVLFITTPDDVLTTVWQEICNTNLDNKIFVHCSGSLASDIFFSQEKNNFSVSSMHPLLAVSDKDNSYKDFSEAFFTIEGDSRALYFLETILKEKKNNYKIIDKKLKTKYHLSAVCLSNLVIGLGDMAIDLLKDCGFDEKEALDTFENLAKNNINNFLKLGAKNSLTGPLERADDKTINRHLEAIKNDENKTLIYKSLSNNLIKVAEQKNPTRDYSKIKQILN